jgi:hypothetical protein
MGYHGIAWASINGPLTGCTLKEWLRDGWGGANRVANAADWQSAGVLRDVREEFGRSAPQSALATLILVSNSTLCDDASGSARHQRE